MENEIPDIDVVFDAEVLHPTVAVFERAREARPLPVEAAEADAQATKSKRREEGKWNASEEWEHTRERRKRATGET